MIGSLTPRRQKALWANAWVWAATGAFAVAVIAGIVLFQKPREVQIAEVTAPAPVPEAPAPPPIVAPAAIPPPVVPKQAVPIGPAPGPEKTPPPPQGDIEALAAVPAPARPLAPQSAPAVGTGTIPAGDLGAGGGGGGRGGFGGVVGGANRAAGQSFAALAARPAPLSFDYRLTPEGVLRIVPVNAGFLTVEVSDAAGSFTPLFTNRLVTAGSVNEIMLPPDAVTALMIFGPRPASSAGSIVHGALDPPSGTKSDPNPTPDSLLVSEIPVKR